MLVGVALGMEVGGAIGGPDVVAVVDGTGPGAECAKAVVVMPKAPATTRATVMMGAATPLHSVLLTEVLTGLTSSRQGRFWGIYLFDTESMSNCFRSSDKI